MLFEQKLDKGLLFRNVRNDQDIERFAAFSAEINNRMEGLTCECILKYFPRTENDNFQIIENPETGGIVSTTCVMPWRVNFRGVSLEAAMPEMIVTRPSHRKMGLIRIQMNRLAETMKERKFDLGILWGIPYYYRQFGYSYAVEGMVTESIHPAKILSSIAVIGSEATEKLTLKKAGSEDIPVLKEYYENLVKPLDIHIERDAAQWTYMIRDTKMSVFLAVRKETGKPAGYIIKALESPTGNVYVLENSIPNREDAAEVLGFLGKECGGELRIRWPRSSTLVRIARDLGSTNTLNTQWLFLIPDIPSFFSKLMPVFNARLAASALSADSATLIVNLFREVFKFTISEGKLNRVESIGFKDSSMGSDGGDLLIPRDAFIRLLFGHNDLSELRDPWPDIVVKPEKRHLIEVLFPKLNAYLYAPYHYSDGEYYG